MSNNRRNFIKAASATGLASFFPFHELLAGRKNLLNEEEGIVITPDSQEKYFIGGRRSPVTIMMSKSKQGVNSLSFCREDIKPADGIPIHKHMNEVELIYIQEGSGIFTLTDKEYPVGKGSVAFVPKGKWHDLRNTGTDTLIMIFSYAPSGFEGYFREIGVPEGVEWKPKSPQEFDAIDRKYGIVYKQRPGK